LKEELARRENTFESIDKKDQFDTQKSLSSSQQNFFSEGFKENLSEDRRIEKYSNSMRNSVNDEKIDPSSLRRQRYGQ
jgi:hypothetical protein